MKLITVCPLNLVLASGLVGCGSAYRRPVDKTPPARARSQDGSDWDADGCGAGRQQLGAHREDAHQSSAYAMTAARRSRRTLVRTAIRLLGPALLGGRCASSPIPPSAGRREGNCDLHRTLPLRPCPRRADHRQVDGRSVARLRVDSEVGLDGGLPEDRIRVVRHGATYQFRRFSCPFSNRRTVLPNSGQAPFGTPSCHRHPPGTGGPVVSGR
jgi:hypothetical protein